MTITNHLLKVLGLVVKYPPFIPPFSKAPIILKSFKFKIFKGYRTKPIFDRTLLR